MLCYVAEALSLSFHTKRNKNILSIKTLFDQSDLSYRFNRLIGQASNKATFYESIIERYTLSNKSSQLQV